MLQIYQREVLDEKLDCNSTRSFYKGILAGLFISIGALGMGIAKASGCNKIVCGLIFSCGLFFVVIAGAELFTGNCMIPGLIIEEKDSKTFNYGPLLIRSYFSNLIGALLIVGLVWFSGIDYTVFVDISVAKCSAPYESIIFKGFLCNLLVCLAVWLGVYIEQTHSKLERFISVVFPVMIFVACGFEHSIANMFFLPFGMINGSISLGQVLIQLGFTTIGNILGGIFFGVLISECNAI